MGRTLLLRSLLCAVLSGFVAAAPAAWVPQRLDEGKPAKTVPERREAPATVAAPAALKAEEGPRDPAGERDPRATAAATQRRGAAFGDGHGPGAFPAAAPAPPLDGFGPPRAAPEPPAHPLPGRALLRAELRAGLLALPPPAGRA